MARGVGGIDVSAVLQQVVTNFQRIRQGAPRCLNFVIVCNGSKLREVLCLFMFMFITFVYVYLPYLEGG